MQLTSLSLLMCPARGAIARFPVGPFRYACVLSQVHFEPGGMFALSSHRWPPSALEGWLVESRRAPNEVAAAATGVAEVPSTIAVVRRPTRPSHRAPE